MALDYGRSYTSLSGRQPSLGFGFLTCKISQKDLPKFSFSKTTLGIVE